MRLLLLALLLGAIIALTLLPARGATDAAGTESRVRRWLPTVLRVSAILLVTLLVISALQRSLLYHPTRDGDFAPRGGRVPIEPVWLTSEDGVRIHGWYLPPGVDQPRDCPAVVYLHGNAGNLTHRRDLVEEMARLAQAHVLIIDYRGFGLSEGSPSESGLYLDACAAFDWLASRDDVDPQRILVFGRSLGGGVASELALRRSPAGLVLESSFTSVADMTRSVFGVPLGFLVLDRYDSLAKLPRVTCPLLVIHGEADDLIPFAHGKRLFESAPGTPESLWISGGRHNDTVYVGGDRYRKVLYGFVRRFAATKGD